MQGRIADLEVVGGGGRRRKGRAVPEHECAAGHAGRRRGAYGTDAGVR
jgi:hypothetical protein